MREDEDFRAAGCEGLSSPQHVAINEELVSLKCDVNALYISNISEWDTYALILMKRVPRAGAIRLSLYSTVSTPSPGANSE